MHIHFSQELLKGLVCYLNLDIRTLVEDETFPYSKPYIYKVLDGALVINEQLDHAFNRLWNERGLTSEDLSKIYTLIDIMNEGKRKETCYRDCKGDKLYDISE